MTRKGSGQGNRRPTGKRSGPPSPAPANAALPGQEPASEGERKIQDILSDLRQTSDGQTDSRHRKNASTASNASASASPAKNRANHAVPGHRKGAGSTSSIGSAPSTSRYSRTTDNQTLYSTAQIANPPPEPVLANQSTLNPSAGGFQPGLHSLEEVDREVLLTPVTGHFKSTTITPSHGSQYDGIAELAHQIPAHASAGEYAEMQQQFHQQQQLQNHFQQLQQLQNMQAMGTLSPTQMIEMQSNLLSQMQVALMGQNGRAAPPPVLAQAPPSESVNDLVAEQMAITAQLENLRAQQDALIARFGDVAISGGQVPTGSASAQPRGPAPLHGSHRRHQSQQVTGTAASNFAASPAASFGAGAMGSIGAGQSLSTNRTGHGRRHSANLASRPATGTVANGAGHTSQSSVGSMGAFHFPGNTPRYLEESAIGGGDVELPMPAVGQNYATHVRRGSVGNLQGWGTNSSHQIQNNAPLPANDLAQAQYELAELSKYRATAGHAKVPSFSQAHFGSPAPAPSHGSSQRKSLFAPYLPQASIPPLLATGKLVIGVLRVNKRNRSDAYVTAEGLESDIYICGSKDRNRALESDTVAVELLDVDEVWGSKKEKEDKKRKKEEATSYDPRAAQTMRRHEKKKDDVEVEGQGLTLFEDDEVTDEHKPTYAGHVVAVISRQPGQLFSGQLGLLRPSSAATKEKQDAEKRERDGIDVRDDHRQKEKPKICWFKPTDKRVPLVAIPVSDVPEDFCANPDAYSSRLFVACIKRWPITSLHPFGTLVNELGPIGDIETETQAILADNNVAAEPFAEVVLKCLPPVPTISEAECDARKDYRQETVFTIDPITAKDLDDAVHIRQLEDGNFEVGIHIADVSHYVKPNTALDREARRRATSVYLVQKVIPMLPAALSETLCSLRANEDKLTFSVVLNLTPDGKVINTWFGKTVIRSCSQLAYSFAQEVIEGRPLPDDAKISNGKSRSEVEESIRLLDTLAQKLRARRSDQGSLRVDNIKLYFALDDRGSPVDCDAIVRRASNELIEEFMLLANTSVAIKVANGLPEQALCRRHEGPVERRLTAFEAKVEAMGLTLDTSSAGALQRSFDAIKDKDAASHLLTQLLVVKTMKQAEYFCTGLLDISKYLHYALNVELYTHFTSPIRRYADVLVHRQLEAVLLGGEHIALLSTADIKFGVDAEGVGQIAQQCNVKRSAAKSAQEASQHLYLCMLISELTQKYGPVVRPANVVAVLDQAFDVFVPEFGIEKRVHIDQMPIDNHVHEPRENSLTLYWKRGVDVVKWLAEHSADAHLQMLRDQAAYHTTNMHVSNGQRSSEHDLFDEDSSHAQHSDPATAIDSRQHDKSRSEQRFVFDALEATPSGHFTQTVRDLQEVLVIVTADVQKSPPVIKVCILLSNPCKG
ncbi:uncharacterized protein L969DRAFT_51735 [Mixia osmundae IAM 14324]|uniref:uncharacterized protein n=1 Tax=Mixia osmundae (strain CBS 9802 / IAM 14324 / JCM 22182 / KY 12970) TaxID=764103 RepID=UPI0004A55269|nr:uncharacterized protein L969DRAFT_51735 [Mixia osmundae IAM 14324]KEI38027.1 hypothetical protein L969DRAFT_51735 [Mixia osmundae IAM 14324]